MIIDFRVRAPFAAYASSSLFTHLDFVEKDTLMRVDSPAAPSAHAFSLPLLLEEARNAGIDKLVVPLRKAVDGKNADLAALVDQFPDTMIGLAGIDPVNLETAIAEVEHYVVHGNCRGIVMEPGQDKTPWMINSPWVFPLYDYCQQHGVPIAFTYGGIMTRSLRYYSPEALDDVAAAFPRLRMALAHGGWPYVTEMCQIAVNRGNVWLAPDLYMVRSPGMEQYVMAGNYLLRSRLIFASAYPILPLAEAKTAYETSGLLKEALPLVMGGNARDFLQF